MKFNKFIYSIFLSVLALAGASVQSCSDEDMPDIPDYTISGEPVELKVAVSLPEMDVKSRGDIGTIEENRVNSLWIRTYSADSRKATSEWEKITPGTTDTEVAHTVTLKTLSGYNYIVAVANVENNGVTPDNLTPRPLSELLEAADTWTGFLNIGVVAPSTLNSVYAPQAPLVMAGCFSDVKVGGNHPEPARLDEWQNKDFQSYFIPVQNGTVDFTANGAIHLRRLVSHLTFNIIPGEQVDVTVNSYRVMNAPVYSWLYERPDTDGMLTNFGDRATSAEDAARFYADVPQFGSQYVRDNGDGSSSFDFWQAENKHTGTAANYNERDAYTGTPRLFTALTGDVWTPNNEASYVLVSCSVDYKENLNVDAEGNVVNTGGSEVTRTGEATYLIHLGYIDGDAGDFNCFRNVNYTYNLTVNGVNDIRLDAYAYPAESYHGEEGMVVDLDNRTIDIDGHYAAFNIQLTEAELSQADFGFMIIAYENGEHYTITDANDQEIVGNEIRIYNSKDNTRTGLIDSKYYNWIELRPTTDENTLAEYKPRYGANADGTTFLLAWLKGGWRAMGDNMKSASGWYTVFVNEYTYEPMYTGNDSYANETWQTGTRPAWMGYVNQAPRRFYVRTAQKVSPDGNSVYARSKYGISQQSLMTYYSEQNATGADGGTTRGSAIAVERINETEGMNLRHTFDGGTSMDNGRWNTAQYLNGSATENTNLSINSTNADARPLWDDFIEYAKPLEVGAVTGNRTQGGPALPARTIASGNPAKLPALVQETEGGSYTFNDPQGNNNYQIEAINACMSRNRDNNGNGRIEPDELRWYVPAMDKYLQIMLGEASMPEPLMDFENIDRLPYVQNNNFNFTGGAITNDYYSRYMIISSNSGRNVMWLMEGTSTSNYTEPSGWTNTTIHPWQVRCVRNLGTNLSGQIREDDRAGTAYEYDEANRRYSMTYYDAASIRTTPYRGNGDQPGQMPIHTIPSDYNSMYYGFEYAANDIVIPTDERKLDMASYINSNPCSELGTEWRIPNQEELTLMRNTGVFGNDGSSRSWLSCTVNYFNYNTGVGSTTDITDKYYLIVVPSQGTQLTQQNLTNAIQAGFYIRCVRDVTP
ncbi:MAG: DUF4906 domain-containing protein [Bacteroidales bacterium]|nr:DUF4906 domain-containing protein [Bacteroidales bacterium]